MIVRKTRVVCLFRSLRPLLQRNFMAFPRVDALEEMLPNFKRSLQQGKIRRQHTIREQEYVLPAVLCLENCLISLQTVTSSNHSRFTRGNLQE